MLARCMVVLMKTETIIHDVASIEICERFYHGGQNPFWTRSIKVTDKDGNTHELSMFSHSEDEDKALKVTI